MDSTPQIEKENGVTVVTLGPGCENIDEMALDKLREPLLEAVMTAEPPLVVLDLTGTNFFGSSFIEVLFRMWNRLNSRSGKFSLCGLTSYCAEIVEITHLDRLWPVCKTRAEAVAMLSK